MSASDHLGQQFRLSHTDFSHEDRESHMLEAHTGNGRKLGVMTWKDGMVGSVSVKPAWQRQGMATQMWNRASEITPGLSHSGNRSDEGNAWAQKVGGPLPPRMQDHQAMLDRIRSGWMPGQESGS